jgi:hypothetical protein
METPEVIAHRSVPQVVPGYVFFIMGALFAPLGWCFFFYTGGGSAIVKGAAVVVCFVFGAGMDSIFGRLMPPRQAEVALMKAHAQELLGAGEFSDDDLREIQRWLNKNDRERQFEKKPEWLKRGDTPIERFARILVESSLFSGIKLRETSGRPGQAP